jgi:hypothetical protein
MNEKADCHWDYLRWAGEAHLIYQMLSFKYLNVKNLKLIY